MYESDHFKLVAKITYGLKFKDKEYIEAKKEKKYIVRWWFLWQCYDLNQLGPECAFKRCGIGIL